MSPTAIRRFAVTVCLSMSLAGAAHAQIAVGANAPAFTKNVLGGGTASLSEYSGKVVILFLLGYGCPFCQSSGPSVQQDLSAYYQTQRPGEVQVIGVDLWNGTPAQLNSFKTLTGTQYPLLLNGATPAGGNLSTSYGTYDNYLVIDAGGVVRYHAALNYAQGARYQLNEIRTVVDGLLGPPLDVPGGSRPGLALAVTPRPARGPVQIALTLPRAEADVAIEVLDTSGRRVAELYRGAAGVGELRLTWSPSDLRGRVARAGVYLVRGRAGSQVVHQRVVVLQ